MQASQNISCLSVIMPCYNEISTIIECVENVLSSPYVAELIIVDDGSSDGTREILLGMMDKRIQLIFHDVNSGKGAALRTGFSAATQDFVIVQDADLEYDPNDFGRILSPMIAGKADVVFGSRFKGTEAQRVLFFWHAVGNKFLTVVSNIFTNLNLTDMETCYKCFRREVIQSLTLEENRFGIEPELTAKIARGSWRIYEVGVSYSGRTYNEGKKIGWKDGFRALYCIVKYSSKFSKKHK